MKDIILLSCQAKCYGQCEVFYTNVVYIDCRRDTGVLLTNRNLKKVGICNE